MKKYDISLQENNNSFSQDILLFREKKTKCSSFVNMSDCLMEHIYSTKLLTSSEKLYYFTHIFYSELFSNWNKKDKSKKKEIEFSGKKIGGLLRYSKFKIFYIQKKLESLEYLHIKRSKNKYGMNNVNISNPTLPKDIFEALMKNNKNNKKTNTNFCDLNEVSQIDRLSTLTNHKTYIPININIAKEIFFHPKLSDISKISFFKIFSILYKLSFNEKKSSNNSYIDLKQLQKELFVSKSTLLRVIKELEEQQIIRLKKIFSKSNEKLNNRFDSILYHFECLLDKNGNNVVLSEEKTRDLDALESPIKNSQLFPQNVTAIPSKITKRNITKRIDKEKIDKKEKSSTSSIFESKKSISSFLKTKEPQKKERTFTLLDFYPLNEKVCLELQRRSGRKFDLNAMNEILKDMSKRLSNRRFKGKEEFMSYMSKAFANEMRNACEVNNIDFRINANKTGKEQISYGKEKFLSQIEESQDISPKSILKRKLAATLNPDKAYALLTSYKAFNIKQNIFEITLDKEIDFSDLEKKNILNHVKSVFDQNENFITEVIIKLEKSHKKQTDDNESDVSLNNVWDIIRTNFQEQYGKIVYKSWFKNVDIAVNEQNKLIEITTSTRFIKDFIKDRYLSYLSYQAKEYGDYLLQFQDKEQDKEYTFS